MNETEEKLADELERTRDDEGEWSNEPVEIEVRPTRTQVVSFRLPLEELEQLAAAAGLVGETLSEYIRGAIEVRVGQSFAPNIDVTHSLKSFTVFDSPSTSGWNETAPAYQSVLDERAE